VVLILLLLCDTLTIEILILFHVYDTNAATVREQHYIHGINGNSRGQTMSNKKSGKSISLVMLLILSSLTGMLMLPNSSAAGINQTTNGTLNGQETWSGTHTLTDNVTIAAGASLVVSTGTTVNIPYGKHIDVQGAICVASTSCGASSDGSAASQTRFTWTLPTDYTIRGACVVSIDTACGSGMVIRNTIDQSKTGLNHVVFTNAYGFEMAVDTFSGVAPKYSALVFDGSETTANGLEFENVNGTNILLVDLANPSITDSKLKLGLDDYSIGKSAALSAYGAGAGISDPFSVVDLEFTGDSEGTCGTNGNGISMIYVENSYANFDDIEITENGYGAFFRQSSGELANSEFTVNCAAVDTKGLKQTGDIKHTLQINNNNFITTDGAGITAYDQARISATGNNISGAEKGSGIAIRSSIATLENNIVGPIGGFNGLWIYGTSDVVAIGNTITDTGREPVVHGEYHYQDSGWPSIQPTESRLYMENNIISNNQGTCNSEKMYGGDFQCPAIHIFRSSATLYNNTVSNSVGDALRIKGGIVNIQGNNMQTESFGVNISHHDDNYGNKYGSIGYFSGNTYTNATQVYNITESRVTIQSEYIPNAGGSEIFPIQLRWLNSECPAVQNQCLKVPDTSEMPPVGMPMSLELVNNSTVLSYAGLQNFDTSKIHVQNQNSAWGTQVREGELVRFQIKASNSNVNEATVIIKNSTGFPLYSLTTDQFGYTPEVTLPSDFYLDRNWNNQVGEEDITVVVDAGPPATTTTMDENTCSDGYDNDGDTLTDANDPDCLTGREIPSYSVEAYKFGKGVYDFDFTLTGPIDDIINLDNMPPSVTLTQPEFTSFARTVSLSGSAWDGEAPPYASDIIAMQKQFGYVEDVQIQPPGSDQWYSAVDTSNSGGMINQESYPFSSWTFDWDMSSYPEGEGDVTFRVRSYDGLEYSPLTVRKFKLNLEAPSVIVNTPSDGQSHSPSSSKGYIVSFSGTASDQYLGIRGSDIQKIWFEIRNNENGQTSKFSINAEVGQSLSAWSYDWDYSIYATGQYTFTIWAADSDFCTNDYNADTCDPQSLEVNIENDNAIPGIVLESMYSGEVIRGSISTPISGYVWDNDGVVTRVEIDIYQGGRNTGNSPTNIIVRQDQLDSGVFNTSWDLTNVWKTNSLPHNSNYEIVLRSFDGQDFSSEISVIITIDNSVDNLAPTFNPSGWANTVKVYCDENSRSLNRCGIGATFDLNEYFNDPEGGTLVFEVYDDPSTEIDNFYDSYFSISVDGIASYNPSATRSDQINSWSLIDVKFKATDGSELSKLSRSVDIDIEAIKFTVLRDNTGSVVTTTEPASFSGVGLPNSLVKARFDSGSGQEINSTRVSPDGTWQMFLTTSQLGSADSRQVVFEMDGQLFSSTNDNQDTQFALSLTSEEESSNLLIIIIIVIICIAVLAGVGAFFFTFEEELEDLVEAGHNTEQAVDPYAWAKNKKVPEITVATQQVQQIQQQVIQQPVQQEQQLTQQATSSQHPGWLWDAETNQWVPDPNYVPGQN
tara:strand:+ start:4341 stop:8903 length:4563 start_codon:yes stop_codon:yes gene_type:complete